MSSIEAGDTALDKGKDGQELTVLVFSPRNPADRRELSWSKHLTVGEAAVEAAAAFGYSGGQPTLAENGTPLERAGQIVRNLGGGEVRIKNLDNRFHDSDTQGPRNESRAKDRR